MNKKTLKQAVNRFTSRKGLSKNPVMLFEHDRRQVIGKWQDIAIKDNQLVAIPLFDHEDEKHTTAQV